MIRPLTLFDDPHVIGLALDDGVEILDVGADLIRLVLVELRRRLDVFFNVEAGAHVHNDM